MKCLYNIIEWILCFFLWSSCSEKQVAPKPEYVDEISTDTLTDMDRLLENGTLRAVTNRQHHYRLQNGRPAGFQFELLDDFCDLLDLNLNLLVKNSPTECYQMLQDGTVDVFACEIDSLNIDSSYYYIVIDLPKEPTKTFAWVIHNNDNDTTLLSAINQWLEDYKKNDMRQSYYRYFKKGKIVYDSTLFDATHISQYDDLIRTAANKIGWDWRLMASIIYQESHFKPDLESSKGAYGLMQLMPVIMERYGIDYDATIEEQLEAGGKLLSYLEGELPESITDSVERQNFVLAAYNAGKGGIAAARQKAAKKGKDPNVWTDNVELHVPKQTYRFVKDVSKRYSHYKALIK